VRFPPVVYLRPFASRRHVILVNFTLYTCVCNRGIANTIHYYYYYYYYYYYMVLASHRERANSPYLCVRTHNIGTRPPLCHSFIRVPHPSYLGAEKLHGIIIPNTTTTPTTRRTISSSHTFSSSRHDEEP